MKKITTKKLEINLDTQTLDLPANAELVRVALDPNTKEPTTYWQSREIDEDERIQKKVKFTLNDRQFDNATKYLGTVVVKNGDKMLELHLLEDFSDE